MTSSTADSTPPSIVPPEAADLVRSFAFENRENAAIVPRIAVSLLIEAEHGREFDEQVRLARLRTWVKQVLRRLRKKGGLHRAPNGDWRPTAALQHSQDSGELRRMAPAELRKPAKRPEARTERPTVESWPLFVERWVFEHRKSGFVSEDLAAEMLSHGFGEGDPTERQAAALRVAEEELRALEGECLLDRVGGHWTPTELLRDWPGAMESQPAASPGSKTSKKRTVVRAEVSASDAILHLLLGCKMGLPGSEIVQHVNASYGYKPNSLRTTIYNLKKKGAIVRSEDGLYNHPDNLA